MPPLHPAAVVLISAMLVPAPSAAATAPDTCHGLTATIVGTDGDDILSGTTGDDVVSLGAGNDTFFGNQGGVDVVCTADGDDEVRASSGQVDTGPGDDRLYSLDGDPTVDLGPGNDIALVDGPAEIMLGDGDDRVTVLEGAAVVHGGPGDDRFDLWGESDPEGSGDFRGARLYGGVGRDTLHWAMDWPMRLDARIRQVTSKGSITGTDSRHDTQATYRSIDRFFGSAYDDVMIGHRGPDRFHGGLGDDRLYGGRGRDAAYGGPGRDLCRAEQRHSCERR